MSVGAREILRGARLVLHAERPPGAPAVTYVAECLLCRHDSGVAHSERKPAAVWAMEHTRRHGLPHGDFLVTTQHHWRVDPAVRPPVPPPPTPPNPPTSPNPPRVPGRHARRRAWPLAEGLVLAALLLVGVTFGVGVPLSM